jgi:energy-coupling factor transport system substrate-specific component
MIGGLLVPYVIRRPGAAFLGEVVAAFVSMAMGNQWGILTMASGLFQGACAEAVFATGRYKHFDGMWLYLAGAASGLSVIMDSFVYHYWSTYAGWSILVAGVFSIISSAVLGGGLSHLLGRSLTWTGVFSGLEISRGSAKRI